MSNHYNIAIIGTGPGGYVAALKAAQMGASTAVIEKSHLGGTCLNWGCIPSKALLTAAELMHNLEHAEKSWGITTGEVNYDWSKIQKHKDKVLRQNRAGINALFKGRKVTLYNGTAALDAPGRIAIVGEKGTDTITADKVILALGSKPTRIPGWPFDGETVGTSDEAVHWSSLPKKLLIVGGGVIGCEFACMMQPFGVDVTVVEMLPGLLPGLDGDLGTELKGIFEKRGIKVHVDTKVEDMQNKDGTATVKLSNGETLEFDRVLVSVGRSPNTKEAGLDKVGIEMSGRGFVPVNDHMQTNVADHYAIGDCNGRCLLAHAASAHGVNAVENALGHAKPFDSPIPSAVYTFPEIGAVGMTEEQAIEQNVPYAVGKFPLMRLGKAMAAQHTDGFVKMIRHRETGALLGAHMIGHNATECIAAAGTALHQKVSMHDLAETVFAHPTIGEAIKESAEDALGMGLHLPPRKVMSMTIGA